MSMKREKVVVGNGSDRRTVTGTAVYLHSPRYRIHYVVPHADQDPADTTPFQGAPSGLIETLHLLEWATEQLAA